jgi:WD40 repeat protein
VVLLEVSDPERRSTYNELGNNVHRVRFSPSGDALAVSAYDGRVRILRPDVARDPMLLVKQLAHGGTANVYALDFSATGDMLISSSGDKTVRFWGE